jgi:adenosylcobinamide kinase/adenosylcobinamide-phosphate guanylyltransferase
MVYFITGGVRSGKSKYAMKIALELSPHPVYIATARKWDKDFEHRIQRHIADRPGNWTVVEEEKELGSVELQGKVAVVDCVTLWLANFFVDNNEDIESSLAQAKEQIDSLLKQECTLIIVSNEIGMGVHAPTETGRKFTDLQGWMNQYIAQKADRVILMISGISMSIK